MASDIPITETVIRKEIIGLSAYYDMASDWPLPLFFNEIRNSEEKKKNLSSVFHRKHNSIIIAKGKKNYFITATNMQVCGIAL